MKIIDSHAHLNFKAFEDDLEEVIERTLEGGVWVVNVGSQYETSKKAVEIAQKYEEGMYASIGMHPLHASKGLMKSRDDEESTENKEEDFDYNKYRELIVCPNTKNQVRKNIVAIGETGLDYYYKPKTKSRLSEFKEKQKQVFISNLKLAKEFNLPVILHCRMAHGDLIETLKSFYKGQELISPRGVIHCFTGNWEEAQEYLKLGFFIGFTGIIFKMDLREVIKNVPMDKILAETDCPYLLPPKREGRNEPLFVKDVIEEIARIKECSVELLSKVTAENARRLFRIK